MPTVDKGQREVIAHFSVTKLALAGPVLLLGSGAFIFFWGRHVVLAAFLRLRPRIPAGYVLNKFGNALNLWGLLLFGVCFVILAWWQFKATRNVIVNGTDAVWIEDGRLVCRGPRPLDIAVSDIKSAELASQYITNVNGIDLVKIEARYISIILKNGKEERLDLGPYREIEDAILAPITARI